MKIKKKRNIFKSIFLGVCACFIAFFSVFSLVNTQDKLEVFADTTTDSFTFSGSNYMTPHRVKTSLANTTYHNSLSSFTVSFTSVNNIISDLSFTYSSYYLTSIQNTYAINIPVNLNVLDTDYYINSNLVIPLAISASNNSNGTITMGKPIKVTFNHYYPTWDTNLCVNTLTYSDINNNTLQFAFYFDVTAFPYGSNNSSLKDYIFWQNRVYFLTVDFTDSEQYLLGYAAGENSAYQSAYEEGYNVGIDEGYNVGKDEGYDLGRNDALTSRYSFTSLITAVIDVPVNTFRSLFNFDFLGVNLSGFFLGLLTCCIVVTVVRMII